MSMKALANLVCEASVRTSENVLKRELERNLDDLRKGVLAFGPTSTTTPWASSTADGHKKLSAFVGDLSRFLRIDETNSKRVLSTYLAGDFRGTKDSLKKLVSEDRYRKPLLRDIWYFYRAERLYLLQVLKEVMTHARSTEHKHADIFGETFGKLRRGDALKKSLFDQLKAVLNETPPTRETLGQYFSEDLVASWTHVNLRELAEILQLLLLYFYNAEDNDDKSASPEEFIELLKLFQAHGFGRKTTSSSKASAMMSGAHSELIEAVGSLEALLLVCLMDLPRLTAGNKDGVWSRAAEIDRLIGGLGNRPEHGPVMLAWMLAHYIVEEDFGRFKTLGERAVQLKVVDYLHRALKNDVIVGNKAISSVAHSTVFAVISVLVSVFEPSRLNLDLDIQSLMCTLLQDKLIATTFWKMGFDSGLGFLFETEMTRFPARLTEFVQLCTALAEASKESADEVLSTLEVMSVYGESVENVPTRDLVHKGGGGTEFELNVSRSSQHRVTMAAGTRATSDGRFYYFDVSYNGIKLMIAEVEQLIRQASLGSSHLSKETLENVVLITNLFEVLLRNAGSCPQVYGHLISKACFLLVEKCVRLPVPPVNLLANCLNSLSLLAPQRPHSVWDKLAETGIFPFMTSTSGGYFSSESSSSDVSPGIVGALLAQHECVLGAYPLTTAFLDLLLVCITAETALQVRPSVVFVIQDIFPSYQQWRFEVAKERERFGQKLLMVIRRVVMMKTEAETLLQRDVIQTLMSPAPNATLLTIASTGDRAIQSLYESQSSLEAGVGVELSRCVHLSLSILNSLLTKTGLENLSALKQVLCAPPTSARPHFLLTIAHYLYHLQSCDLPLAAVKLMSTVATILPMSLLACLGSDAEAVRDILVHRLEAQTEDVLLKIAIVKFFTACVESQPGLIQLLIGVKPNVDVVASKNVLSASEVAANDNLDLVTDHGCLSTILELLVDLSTKPASTDVSTSFELHLAIAEFVYSLWSNQRVVAVEFLKRKKQFWESLSKPLFETTSMTRAKLVGFVLSILSSEIYTYKGKVNTDMLAILERLADEKSEHISGWCLAFSQNYMEADETASAEEACRLPQGDKSNSEFLLSSWKAFLVVLSRDQPITVSPKTCQAVLGSLIKAIRYQLTQSNPDIIVTTALSELCLVLMQRWQTKCVQKMEIFIRDLADLLAETSQVFETLNSRSRSAILAIASTALKFSAFMMDKEEDVLSTWLRPVVDIVEKSLASVDYTGTSGKEDRSILSLCLLQSLLSRFGSSVNIWQSTFHQRLVVQTVMSALHHTLRARAKPELARECLGLLILVCRSDIGCDALLSSCDFSQMLWLPLSALRSSGDVIVARENWSPVFQLAIHLATNILRVGKQRTLETSLSAVALLQDHLTSFFCSLREGIQIQQLDLTLSAASFIATLLPYYKQWQLHHPSSLGHFYTGVCSLMHQSVCLLTRPSFLSTLIGQQEKEKEAAAGSGGETSETSRARRRMSSAEYVDGHFDAATPEVASVQNRLLGIVGACLTSLLALSPDLLALVTDDIVDTAAFQQLLQVGFSTPSFEQDESMGLSYGTVIALCNLCIRAITRTSDRSPSPKSGGSTGTGSGSDSQFMMDRRRLILVLEKSVTLVLTQGLLFLADPRIATRDKQLLRRELGAELASITGSLRRYTLRGPMVDSSSVSAASKSPTSSAGGRLSKSDEMFMKFVTTVVQKTFK